MIPAEGKFWAFMPTVSTLFSSLQFFLVSACHGLNLVNGFCEKSLYPLNNFYVHIYDPFKSIHYLVPQRVVPERFQ